MVINLNFCSDFEHLGQHFFFIFIAAPEGHTVVHFGEEIISIMSGTYYIDYSSSVLARTAQLLSTLTWLLNLSRSGDPRSLARSPPRRLDVGADSETSTRFQFRPFNTHKFEDSPPPPNPPIKDPPPHLVLRNI